MNMLRLFGESNSKKPSQIFLKSRLIPFNNFLIMVNYIFFLHLKLLLPTITFSTIKSPHILIYQFDQVQLILKHWWVNLDLIPFLFYFLHFPSVRFKNGGSSLIPEYVSTPKITYINLQLIIQYTSCTSHTSNRKFSFNSFTKSTHPSPFIHLHRTISIKKSDSTLGLSPR